MATQEAQSNTTNPTTTIPINNTSLVVLRTAGDSSVKLNGTNYSAWKVQMDALLIGYGLDGYTDVSFLCPAAVDPNHTRSIRQNKLIIHGILSSVHETVVTLLGFMKTLKQAWDILAKTYASKSRTRVLSLQERLTTITKGELTMAAYLQQIKLIADELSIIRGPLNATDMIINVLDGPGFEFKEIATAIRTRDSDIFFAELHQKLVDYEVYLMKTSRVSPRHFLPPEAPGTSGSCIRPAVVASAGTSARAPSVPWIAAETRAYRTRASWLVFTFQQQIEARYMGK